MTRFLFLLLVRLCTLMVITAGEPLWAQPLDPRYVTLPAMSRLTGWISDPVGVDGSAQEFGQSVMPLAAQSNGLPGIMIRHNRADTFARGTYPVESLFYRGTAGRFPDSSDRQRIGMSEIGSQGRLLCAGDWDDDGYRDLAMYLRLYNDSTFGGWDYTVGRVVIFWGNVQENYSLGDTSRLILVTEEWGGAWTASNRDFDGDGRQDLFVMGDGGIQQGVFIYTAQLHIFRGMPGQRWGRAGHKRTADWSIWNAPKYRRLAIVDQDHDGSVDIIFHDDHDGRIATLSVMYGRQGAFPDTTDVETVALTLANGHYSIFSDITGDGVPELLVNTGSDELIRIYAGAPGQRLKDQYGSGYDPPLPERGFWRRPWVEISLPNKLDESWPVAGWGGLFDLGDANHDGIDDIWLYCEPNIICYTTGKYLDELVDAVVAVPGTEFISAANVGDISGTGRPALAVGYDWIPHDFVNPFPGGVMFVRTDTSFTTSNVTARRLPTTTSEVATTGEERSMEISIYPNPAHERAIVRWGEQARGEVRLSVVDVLGRERGATVVDAVTDHAELDLHALPAGSYRVIVRSGASIRSIAFVRI